MEGMVEENGTSGVSDPLAGGSAAGGASAHVVAATSIVQLTLPAQAPLAQVPTYFVFNVVLFLSITGYR